jgi:hypothetical protein
VVLLTDLENVLGPSSDTIDYSIFLAFKNNRRESTLELKQWCRFLASLLHHRLTKIHLPSRFYWNKSNRIEFMHLLDEIGTKCSRLQLIENKTNFFNDPPDMKEKDIRLKEAFFRALPQLVNLKVVRLFFFICDDWALQQFGENGKNIV